MTKPRTPARLFATVLVGVAALLAAANAATATVPDGLARAGLAVTTVAAIVAAVLGFVVEVRTGNRAGRALLLAGVAGAAWAWAGGAAVRGLADADRGITDWLLWLQAWAPPIAAASLGIAILRFPDGGATGRRRIAVAALVAGAALSVLGTALRPGALRTAFGLGAATVRNPTGLDRARDAADGALVAGVILVGVGLAGALVWVARCFRASSGGERAQAGWLLGSAVAAVVVALAAIPSLSSGEPADAWQVVVGTTAGVGVPAGIAIAVVRHRAFGVYRFVGYLADHRIWTVTNALLALALVLAVPVLAAIALGVERRPLAVAALALATAAAVFPVWRRRQRTVDGRFGQRQLDPARELERFTETIEQENTEIAPLRGPVFDLLRGFAPVVVREGENGMRFAVATGDREIGRHTFVHGGYDLPTMRRAIEELTSRTGRASPLAGRTVVDVGANVGTSIVPLLVVFGATKGVAIEPAPANVELLRATLLLNGLVERVRVVEAAASDAPGTLSLELAADNWGDHRLRSAADPSGSDAVDRAAIEVPVVRLDGVLEESGVSPEEVGLVWIDVQGHEGHVLAGAPRLLAAGAPVVVEFWPDALRRAGGLDRLYEIAAACFRTAVDLRGGGERSAATLPGLAEELDGPDAFTDLLLLP